VEEKRDECERCRHKCEFSLFLMQSCYFEWECRQSWKIGWSLVSMQALSFVCPMNGRTDEKEGFVVNEKEQTSVSIVVKEVDDCWEGTGVTILATW